MTDLGGKITKMMNISPHMKRMDSMMIATNIRKLSRVELLYTCIAKLILFFHKRIWKLGWGVRMNRIAELRKEKKMSQALIF